MAWRCTGNTNIELITNLMHNELINSESVATVRAFSPSVNRRFWYHLPYPPTGDEVCRSRQLRAR